MLDSSIAKIVRGLPREYETGCIKMLVEELERDNRGNKPDFGDFLDQIEAAAQLMIPLPDYDVSDFVVEDIIDELEHLLEGDKSLWGQLLHALDDRHSGLFSRLKSLSPFAGGYLMFLDTTGNAATLRAELDDELAAVLLQRADAHEFPGNSYVVIVPPEVVDLLQFVDGVDISPATV